MKRIILFLFILQFSLPGLAANSNNEHVDSLQLLLENSKETRSKVDLLNQLSFAYFAIGGEEAANNTKLTLTNAIKLSRKLRYTAGLAEALFHMGRYHLNVTDSYADATPCFLESLALFEEMNDKKGIAKCYLQLGIISYVLQYYEDAIKNFNLSLSFNNDPTAIYLTAISYSELDSFKIANTYFRMAIQDYTKTNNKPRLNECNMYLGKMFYKLNEYDSAKYYLNLVIDNNKINTDSTALIRPFAFISSVYLKTNDINQAIHYGELSYQLSNKNFDQISLIEAATTLNKAYAIKGDFTKAYFYLDLLNTSKDNFFKGSTKQKVADMQSMFDYNKKINDQKQLQIKDRALAQQQIQKEKILRNSFLLGSALLVLLLAALYNRFIIKRNANDSLQEKNAIILIEKERSENLLLNILPVEVAEELKTKGSADAKQFEAVTVMFTDFKGFTKISENLSPSELVAEIDTCFKAFDNIITNHNIEKIKTIGDAYMCVGGLPVTNTTHAVDVVNAAIEIQIFMNKHIKQKLLNNKEVFEVRIGIHSGPVVAGIVGVKKFAYDIWGDTVNIASRMESSGEEGKINISGTTYELIKDKFNCIHRGKIEAKGKGEIDMYFVEEN